MHHFRMGESWCCLRVNWFPYRGDQNISQIGAVTMEIIFETINIVIGTGVIILNLIPFILKKSRYVLLTGLVSLLMLFLLAFFIRGMP